MTTSSTPRPSSTWIPRWSPPEPPEVRAARDPLGHRDLAGQPPRRLLRAPGLRRAPQVPRGRAALPLRAAPPVRARALQRQGQRLRAEPLDAPLLADVQPAPLQHAPLHQDSDFAPGPPTRRSWLPEDVLPAPPFRWSRPCGPRRTPSTCPGTSTASRCRPSAKPFWLDGRRLALAARQDDGRPLVPADRQEGEQLSAPTRRGVRP